MARVNFDMDVLRSFVTGIELGSFAKAADRVGRSTSAISAQLKKLEVQIGVELLRKSGRGLVLTDAGETFMAYAKRLLALNDEAASAIRAADLAGSVRIGLQEDFGERVLTDILGAFARAHPRVRIEARVTRNAELLDLLNSGRLDLALAWDSGTDPVQAQAECLGKLPMRWIGASDSGQLQAQDRETCVPLVVFEAPCMMRSHAIQALDRAGLPWRIAFISSSLSGIWAAIAAGLGVTVRTQAGLPETLRIKTDLPALPDIRLMLHFAHAEPTPPVHRLAHILRDNLNQRLALKPV